MFLDYYATGKLNADEAALVVQGIAEGCRQAGAALAGGETAEMPGMYGKGDYDLAGFSVGAAERGTLLPRVDEMKAGDVIVGIASSGPHSNGYSLVRKVVERSGLAWDAPAPFATGKTLAEALLTPTRIYAKALKPVFDAKLAKGAAHITGGGLVENTPRALPDHLEADVRLERVEAPCRVRVAASDRRRAGSGHAPHVQSRHRHDPRSLTPARRRDRSSTCCGELLRTRGAWRERGRFQDRRCCTEAA